MHSKDLSMMAGGGENNISKGQGSDSEGTRKAKEVECLGGRLAGMSRAVGTWSAFVKFAWGSLLRLPIIAYD